MRVRLESGQNGDVTAPTLLPTLATLAFLFQTPAPAAEQSYDPLAVPAGRPAVRDLVVVDAARRREIPLRVYMPAGREPAPVVLFSHGLGGSREMGAYLGNHWALRGYVAVFLQHPGSDDAVWRDAPVGRRRAALREAADPAQFLRRVEDVPAVLDQLEKWNRADGHVLAGRLDPARIGMAGHSFGAVTTQAVGGQRTAWVFTEPRVRAAVVMSPSAPRRGRVGRAFGEVAIPWLLMTGTNDVAPIGDADLKSRLAVFPALPAGGKYELVLDGAEHSAFTDRELPGASAPRNPNHHRAILAISTAFWDAWLERDPAARAWLDGAGPRSVLETRDRWRRK
jgi:predicted dienelactone hydrolase